MKYYLVKNIGSADKIASSSIRSGTMSGDNYDLVVYASKRTFSGEETSVQEVTPSEYRSMSISPVFYDYSNDSPEKINSSMESLSKQDRNFCSKLKNAIENFMIAKSVPSNVQTALLFGSFSSGGFEEFLKINNPSLLLAFLPVSTGTGSIENLSISIDASATDAAIGWTSLRNYLENEIQNYINLYVR